ncbi:hypothetical protein M0R45_007948 [Rubus argutus]|uniref:Uncharacterized protein n=1 Tax=Rubus argutus TaxID=59490 RepID=A0AAW1Y0L2_RUBAR
MEVSCTAVFILLESSPVPAAWHKCPVQGNGISSLPFEALHGDTVRSIVSLSMKQWLVLQGEQCLHAVVETCLKVFCGTVVDVSGGDGTSLVLEGIPEDTRELINIEAIIEEDEIKEDKLRDVRLMLDMVMMAHNNIRKGVYAIGQISS